MAEHLDYDAIVDQVRHPSSSGGKAVRLSDPGVLRSLLDGELPDDDRRGVMRRRLTERLRVIEETSAVIDEPNYDELADRVSGVPSVVGSRNWRP